MLTGNRDIKEGEIMPEFEQIEFDKKTSQIRFDFQELTNEHGNYYQYNYVHCSNNKNSIIEAVIRSSYTQSAVEAIINNFLDQKNIIEYLKFQNFRGYAKAVASKNVNLLNEAKVKQVYKVTLPFTETLENGDYESLSNRMLKANITFESDVVNDTAIGYLGFILPSDLEILQSDPRVTIEIISLWEDA